MTDVETRDELRAGVRRWVEREVLPVAGDLEHEDEYPADLVAQMQAMGLFGITIPEEHGGLGLDLHAYIAVIEELAAGWMSLSGIINTHTIAASLIMRQGTPEQQARWLPGLAHGRAARLPLAVRARRRAATRATSRAARGATATST